jgi:hypothetical protein
MRRKEMALGAKWLGTNVFGFDLVRSCHTQHAIIRQMLSNPMRCSDMHSPAQEQAQVLAAQPVVCSGPFLNFNSCVEKERKLSPFVTCQA